MTGIFIVPTGIGAKIGGHAGDASPAAKLIAACCDKLIINPNVVNASDINEMTDNMLYVDGAMIDDFLNGNIGLSLNRRLNRILLLANGPVTQITLNAANAARTTIGVDITVRNLEIPLEMIATKDGDRATGQVNGLLETADYINNNNFFDVIALHTPIIVNARIALDYFKNGGVNPWGGVEALVSRRLSQLTEFKYPIAHAPLETENDLKELKELKEVEKLAVNPRMAAEVMSIGFLHCVLKGLHNAPLPGDDLTCKNIDFMVTPYGCWGPAHEACHRHNIPIIMVEENSTIYKHAVEPVILVQNYWEAAGYIMSLNARISPASVRC